MGTRLRVPWNNYHSPEILCMPHTKSITAITVDAGVLVATIDNHHSPEILCMPHTKSITAITADADVLVATIDNHHSPEILYMPYTKSITAINGHYGRCGRDCSYCMSPCHSAVIRASPLRNRKSPFRRMRT